jgi:large subunit ribosomal protein L4
MAYTMSIVDMKGKKIKDLSLEGSLFADEHINEGLLHEYVVMYLANGRHAIAHTKTRGEVKRSGAKLYRQK